LTFLAFGLLVFDWFVGQKGDFWPCLYPSGQSSWGIALPGSKPRNNKIQIINKT
jgi:hypothetical protein